MCTTRSAGLSTQRNDSTLDVSRIERSNRRIAGRGVRNRQFLYFPGGSRGQTLDFLAELPQAEWTGGDGCNCDIDEGWGGGAFGGYPQVILCFRCRTDSESALRVDFRTAMDPSPLLPRLTEQQKSEGALNLSGWGSSVDERSTLGCKHARPLTFGWSYPAAAKRVWPCRSPLGRSVKRSAKPDWYGDASAKTDQHPCEVCFHGRERALDVHGSLREILGVVGAQCDPRGRSLCGCRAENTNKGHKRAVRRKYRLRKAGWGSAA